MRSHEFGSIEVAPESYRQGRVVDAKHRALIQLIGSDEAHEIFGRTAHALMRWGKTSGVGHQAVAFTAIRHMR